MRAVLVFILMWSVSSVAADFSVTGDVNAYTHQGSTLARADLRGQKVRLNIPGFRAGSDLKQALSNWSSQSMAYGPGDGSQPAQLADGIYYPATILSGPDAGKTVLIPMEAALSQGKIQYGGANAPVQNRRSIVAPTGPTAPVAPTARAAAPVVRPAPPTAAPQRTDAVDESSSPSLNERWKAEAQAPCVDCAVKKANARTTVPVPKGAANTRAAVSDYLATQGYPPGACSSFIKGDGSYGQHGQTLRAELEKYSVFSDSQVNWARRVCPNYSKFKDPEQRYHFWAWLMTDLVAKESGCRDGVPSGYGVQNPNGVAWGFFQMEGPWWLRRARNAQHNATFGDGRSPCGTLNQSARYAPVNITCAVSILAVQLVQNGAPGYWGPWNTGRIGSYPGCR